MTLRLVRAVVVACDCSDLVKQGSDYFVLWRALAGLVSGLVSAWVCFSLDEASHAHVIAR